MKNKILSLLMVATMAVGMLAGCGSKTNAPADNQVKEETPATEATAEPATEEAAGPEIPTELEHIKVKGRMKKLSFFHTPFFEIIKRMKKNHPYQMKS